MSKAVTLEICIDSVAGAQAAARGGADRVELCANLLEGGTTPSTGMIRSVVAAEMLPVMVMIRPRGGHFCFSPSEQAVMLREAEAVLAEPIAGVVIGALTAAGDVDVPVCRELRRLAGSRSVTFHRAFDQTRDPFVALEQLIELNVDRVLTSGQAASAEAGLPLLGELVRYAAGRVSVMPGCGVRAANAARIVAATGVTEIHCSASRVCTRDVRFWRDTVPMSAKETTGDLRRRETQFEEVAAISRALRASDC